jgi:hypothetical protein
MAGWRRVIELAMTRRLKDRRFFRGREPRLRAGYRGRRCWYHRGHDVLPVTPDMESFSQRPTEDHSFRVCLLIP